VVFSAFSGIGRGVYAWDGSAFHRVVDELMAGPPGSGSIVAFADAGEIDVNGWGDVVFVGQDEVDFGVFRWRASEGLSRVYRRGDPSPVGPGTFAELSPRLWGDDTLMVHYSIDGPSAQGIVRYSADGPPTSVTPAGFEIVPPRIDVRGELVFAGVDPNEVRGIWGLDVGGEPELLLPAGVPLGAGLPGEVWNGFVGGLLRFGLGGVVFRGAGDLGTRGVYLITGPGQWENIYEHGDIEPRTGLPIELSPEHHQSASNNRLVFVARTDELTYHLLLREPDGTLVNLISTGDVLEGEVASRFYLTTKAMPDDNTVYVEIDRESETAIWRIGLEPLGGPNPLEIPTSSRVGMAAMVALLAVVALTRLVRS
jgi:hypothetical protein